MDNFQSEKQQRLLVEPLYSSWSPGIPFIAAANVRLFYALKQDPLVPDAVFAPLKQLQGKDELNGTLLKVWVLTARKYVELPQPFWLETVGLGLTLWAGEFEWQSGLWLRWCDEAVKVISTLCRTGCIGGTESKSRKAAG